MDILQGFLQLDEAARAFCQVVAGNVRHQVSGDSEAPLPQPVQWEM